MSVLSDTKPLDEIIVGRVEPRIYAFLTSSVPRYLKVGDTYRPVPVRIAEWRKHFTIDEKRDVWDWPAVLDGEVFFRDYSVHQFLQDSRKLIRLDPGTLKRIGKGKNLYFSNEFFLDARKEHVEEALADIKEDREHSTGKYSFYSVGGIGQAAEDEPLPDPVDLKLRPNQAEAVERFKAAVEAGRTNLLMYAVMRFGKTVTSLQCARELEASFVVVVSGKADVAREWKNTVLGFTDFRNEYVFLSRKDLEARYSRVTEELKAGHKVVLFATLQDLQGDAIKPRHEQIFANPIDLLVIDETHFAARAAEYGKPLRVPPQYAKADASEEASAEDAAQAVKALDAKVRLHLSGTPYRILMGSEFQKEDIVSFCQFTDIANEQRKWDEEHLGQDEWENPYYGFPQMVRFAFNLNESARKKLEELEADGKTSRFRELFRPASMEKDTSPKQLHKKFVHEKEVVDLLRAIGGTAPDPGILPFLDYDKIVQGQMCHHIVCVLPWCASCDALEAVLTSRKYKRAIGKLAGYKVINISGKEVKKGFVKIADVAKTIAECEKRGEKTLTLTVNRMLTGSTVPEWDTMLFLKDTSSPQEYDQAVFRLQSSFVRSMPDGQGREIKYDMKPQTLLVDFDPTRMFRLQEARAQAYNVNTERNGNRELESRVKRELEVSPVVLFNKDRIHRVEAADVMAAVSQYSSTRGVAEEVEEVPVDAGACDDPRLKALIGSLPELGSKAGLTIAPHVGEETDVDTMGEGGAGADGENRGDNASTQDGNADERDSFLKRIKTYHALIVFYSFLVPERVHSLDEILQVIDKNENNRRIARHLGLAKNLLALYREKVGWQTLQKLDYKIQNLDRLANETQQIDLGAEYKDTPEPVRKAIVAMRKFGRLGEAKVVTPPNVAYDMVRQIPAAELKALVESGEKILDPASKMGEFAIAIVRRCAEPDIGLAPDVLKETILSIPMCGVTYEFTRKIYELLGLDPKCIARPENMTTYDLLKVREEGSPRPPLDFARIKRLLTQNKDFDTISIGDDLAGEDDTMCTKIGFVISNPPYQEKDGGAGASAAPLYQDYIELAKTASKRWTSCIVPSRWYAGGKGLDEFRDEMLDDAKMSSFNDFPNPDDCFPGLSVNLRGGVCFFLRDEEKAGGDNKVQVVTHLNGNKITSSRPLRTPGYDLFLRWGDSIPIIEKIREISGDNVLSNIVSSRKPFGLSTDFSQTENFRKTDPDGTLLTCIGKGLVAGFVERSQIVVHTEWIDRWKVLIPRANNIGTELPDDNLNTFVYGKKVVCTESYLVVGADLALDKSGCNNLAKYLHTKFVRFLHGLAKASHDAPSKTFRFVPLQDFTSHSDIDWSRPISEIDQQLYDKYALTVPERQFIESMIKPMG